MVPLTEDFLFRAGTVTEGMCEPVLREISTVQLNQVGLSSRIVLSGVKLEPPYCAGDMFSRALQAWEDIAVWVVYQCVVGRSV